MFLLIDLGLWDFGVFLVALESIVQIPASHELGLVSLVATMGSLEFKS